MQKIHCRIKDYIQPFERDLALRELATIAGAEPRPCRSERGGNEFVVATSRDAEAIAERLAYWETVSHGDEVYLTTQSLRESTVNVVRNGIDLNELKRALPFEGSVPLPNRRCLRYGAHGIHEYRGKFFPQLVRSLINVADVPSGGLVADPMSGSGTTVVEAVLAGCRGIGLDMNPLSTYLGRTKCELLAADAKKLEAWYLKVREAVLAPETRRKKTFTYLDSLPRADQDYLRSWFAEEVLRGLDDISSIILGVSYAPAQNLMRICLSNILRSVSWQKDDDLRVRKEVRLDVETDPKKEFMEEMGRSIRAILAFLLQNGRGERIAEFDVQEGDARHCDAVWGRHIGKVDAVITSPPYATALPYLDTDRLSLCYLGLLPRPEHRQRDQLMIGNREVTDKTRRNYLDRGASEGEKLPESVHRLVNRIQCLNEGTDAGFRKKNLPALLTKYFFDMRDVFRGVLALLKPGGTAFVVVGNNHTVAGGERVEIKTAKLLAEIADLLEFEVLPPIDMDMLVSRDIFRKNAMSTEEILVLKKR